MLGWAEKLVWKRTWVLRGGKGRGVLGFWKIYLYKVPLTVTCCWRTLLVSDRGQLSDGSFSSCLLEEKGAWNALGSFAFTSALAENNHPAKVAHFGVEESAPLQGHYARRPVIEKQMLSDSTWGGLHSTHAQNQRTVAGRSWAGGEVGSGLISIKSQLCKTSQS
jgi:hypothetical protein